MPFATCYVEARDQVENYRKSLMPSPTEKITIKNLHLSTHNKRKFIINIGTLARFAHTYKSRIEPFGVDRGLPLETVSSVMGTH